MCLRDNLYCPELTGPKCSVAGQARHQGLGHAVEVTLTPADAVDIIQLWPDGPPTRIEGVPPEVEFPVPYGIAENTTFLRNISDPTLTVFAPQGSSNGLGIIVVPGGGWTINAWTHEGLDVADWLTSLGYTAFLLKYRVQASDADQETFMAQQAALDAGLAAGFGRWFSAQCDQ